jgi:hypothetical protein
MIYRISTTAHSLERAHLCKIKPIARMASAVVMRMCKIISSCDKEEVMKFYSQILNSTILFIWNIYVIFNINSGGRRIYSHTIIFISQTITMRAFTSYDIYFPDFSSEEWMLNQRMTPLTAVNGNMNLGTTSLALL